MSFKKIIHLILFLSLAINAHAAEETLYYNWDIDMSGTFPTFTPVLSSTPKQEDLESSSENTNLDQSYSGQLTQGHTLPGGIVNGTIILAAHTLNTPAGTDIFYLRLKKNGSIIGEDTITVPEQTGGTYTYQGYSFEIQLTEIIDVTDTVELQVVSTTATNGDSRYFKIDAAQPDWCKLVFTVDDTPVIVTGDIDGSGSISLADTIIALQVTTNSVAPGQNLNPAATIVQGAGIGVAEAIYTLKAIAETP